MKLLNTLVIVGLFGFASYTFAAGNSGSTGTPMDSQDYSDTTHPDSSLSKEIQRQQQMQRSSQMNKKTSYNTLEEHDVFGGRGSGGSSNYSDSATGISQ